MQHKKYFRKKLSGYKLTSFKNWTEKEGNHVITFDFTTTLAAFLFHVSLIDGAFSLICPIYTIGIFVFACSASCSSFATFAAFDEHVTWISFTFSS